LDLGFGNPDLEFVVLDLDLECHILDFRFLRPC
jgi:hypothetical protein